MKKQLWSILAISLMLMPLFLTVYTMPLASDLKSNDNLNQNQDNDTMGDIPNENTPVSSSLSSITNTRVTNTQIVAANLTALHLYDIWPSYGWCPDILVGTASGTFYVIPGVTQPFTELAWTTYPAEATGSASEIRSIFAMQMNNLDGTATDVYVNNKLGYQYNIQQSPGTPRQYYYPGLGGYATPPGNQGNTSLEIDGNIPTSSVKTELGGLYDLNDEVVVGLSNGHIVYVVTQQISNLLESKFIEYNISLAYSTYIYDVAVGDMNNDGDKDVVASYASGNIYTFENDGTPQNGVWSSQLTASKPGFAIELSDLDLDGKLDLIAGTTGGEIYLYKNNGNPHGSTFTEFQMTDLNQKIRDIKAADFDLDGDKDIICALENYTIMILENPLHMPIGSTELDPFTKTNWYRIMTSWASGNGRPNYIEIADLDYNGVLDAVCATDNGYIQIIRNNKNYPSTNDFVFGPKELIATTPYTSRFNKIAYGDLDNDGDIDIAVGTWNNWNNPASENGTIRVYKNPGYTIFRNFTIPNTWDSYIAYGFAYSDFYGISLQDIDRDGYLDLLVIENRTVIRGIRNTGNPWTNYWDNYNSVILFRQTSYATGQGDTLFCEDLDYDYKKEFIWLAQPGSTNQANLTAYRQQTNPWLTWNDGVNITWNPSGYSISNLKSGYINDDNYKDLIFSDSSGHIYVTNGRQIINSMPGSQIKNVLSLVDGVKAIAVNDYDKNYQQDIAYSMTGANPDLQVLSPTWTGVETYNINNILRTDFSSGEIEGIVCVDLNKNGLLDYIFWTGSGLYSLKGNVQDGTYETASLIESYSGKKITDVAVTDFDLDGDPDLIVAIFNSTASELYYLANRKNDDITAPTLTLTIEPIYSANQVEINISSSETLYSSPQIKISVGSTTYYDVMTPDGSLKWTYTHTILLNGTYTVSVNGSDINGNLGVQTGVFFGDKILPSLTITAIGGWRAGYSNGTVTIRVTNSTDLVGNNQIGLNITHPILGTTVFSMVNYNPTEHAFIYVYSGVTVNGIYTVGVNASDQYFVDYRYSTITFQGDLSAPLTTIVHEPKEDIRDTFLSNKGLHFNASFNEPIISLDVYAWRTGVGNLSNSIYYYCDYLGETDINFTFDLPRGVKGDMNLTFTFVDRAGNYNYFTINVSITVFPPVFCGFFFIDPDTEEQYITQTEKRMIAIQWSGVNFTTLMYRINDGAWSYTIAHNHPERMAYPIDLGLTGGELTITVRFMNDDDFVDIQNMIVYNPPLPEIPWQWIVISLGVLAVAGVLIKFTRPKRKERSWKEFLDK